MTREILFIFATLLFSTVIFGQNNPDEPKLNLELTINGKKYFINDGDTIKSDNLVLTVKSADFKIFKSARLSFNYPKQYTFQHEQDSIFETWTLDGNDLIITYFIFNADVKLDDFIGRMVKKFGRKNCKTIDCEIKLGDIALKGKRINVELIGTKLTYDMFQFKTDDNKTYLISFQDSKKDDGTESEEYKSTMEMINSSIKIK